MVKNSKILEYARLFRLQTGAITAVAPILGYLCITAISNDLDPDLLTIFLLFSIGIFMHIFVFVLNEYIDVDIDRLSPDLAEKPLVKQSVTMNGAIAVIIISFALCYVITTWFFLNFWALIILTLSFICGAIYDVYGKRFPGSDFVLAAWIFWLCLFGASIKTSSNPFEFPLVLYILAGLGFMQIVFNNAVEGGIKDVDHDHLGGAKTLAIVLGVNVRQDKLFISRRFKAFLWVTKIVHICLIIALIFMPELGFRDFVPQYIQLILIGFVIFLIAVAVYTIHKFTNQDIFNRSKLKRIFSIHEISTYFIVPIILIPLIGFFIALGLLLLPLIWYILLNLILYNRPLEPRV